MFSLEWLVIYGRSINNLKNLGSHRGMRFYTFLRKGGKNHLHTIKTFHFFQPQSYKSLKAYDKIDGDIAQRNKATFSV